MAVLVIAVVAAVAVLGFTQVRARAAMTAATVTVRQLASAAQVEAARVEADKLTPALLNSALADSSTALDVTGLQAAGNVLHLVADAPKDRTEISVAFDDGWDTDTTVTGGSRMMLIAATGDGRQIG